MAKFDRRSGKIEIDVIRAAMICPIGSFLFFLPIIAICQNFTAEISPTTIAIGDSAILKITLDGETQLEKIEPPKLNGLYNNFHISYIGSKNRHNWENHEINTGITWSYRLKPRKIGRSVIPKISIRYDNKIYQTDIIEINIIAKDLPNSFHDDFYGGLQKVDAIVDHQRPFVNEQIIFTFRYFYETYVPGKDPEYRSPSMDGFWKFDLKNPYTSTEKINGKTLRVDQNRTALFPMKSGEIQISPAILDYPTSITDPDQKRKLATNPITLTVRPLPSENKPINFSGAVGQFDLAVSVDPKTIKLGEATTLKIKIFGRGNIKSVSDLKIDLGGNFTVHEPKIETEINEKNGVIESERRYEFTIVPTKSGDLKIPSIEFNYFDLQQLIYQTVKSKKITITATGTKFSENIETNSGSKNYIFVPILLISFAVIGGVFWFVTNRSKNSKTEINPFASIRDFSHLANVIYGEIGKISDLPPHGLNPTRVKEVLSSCDDRAVGEIVDLLRLCDSARFDRNEVEMEMLIRATQRAKIAINSLFKQITKIKTGV